MAFDGYGSQDVICGNEKCRHVALEKEFRNGCPVCGYHGYYPITDKDNG